MTRKILIAGLAVGAWAGQPAEVAAQAIGVGFEANPRAAITQVGTRGANFLRIGPSARARALGEAGTALVDGANSLYFNPAVAALTESFAVATSLTQLFGSEGLEHTHVALVVPVGAGAIGAHALMLNSGNIQPTTEWSPYGFDTFLGDAMEWKSLSVGATYARRITDRLAIGATGKMVQEGVELAEIRWFGLDVGTVFETGVYGTRLAMSVLHIGGEARFEGPFTYGTVTRGYRVFEDKILGSTLYFRFDTEKIQLPTTFRMGVQAPLLGSAASIFGGAGGAHSLNLLGEVNDGFDTAVESRWGIEYSFRDLFFARGGKYFQNEDRSPLDMTDNLSVGAGVRLPFLGRNVSVDYSFTTMGVLDNVQTISFQLGSF
jgi:hypothetical protein